MKRFLAIFAVILLGAALPPTAARAGFGADEFDVAFTGADGSPSVQAGSHPFAFAASLELNPGDGETEGDLKELFLSLPPGLATDTAATPRCADADFNTLDGEVNDCPDSTALGFAVAANGGPDSWSYAPVFNLVPAPGELMRLGFRVAGVENVVARVGLSSEPPYEATVTVGDFPDSVELFGAQLQLWGVPADPSHNALRGSCLASSGESSGSCPVAIPQRPLLTLPTRCDGPLAVGFRAVSWEDDENMGNALTHDGVGGPLGLSGCDRLAFLPLALVAPSTDAAASPAGLDLSVAFADEGLANPSGLAESQVRDLALTLPEGMDIDAAAADAVTICSPAELAEEALEAASEEGCPEDSKVGSIEASSPLLEGVIIGGDVFRGTPDGVPWALYLVLRNADLGILLKQVVELEPDPETGQLVGYAEDLPQLPFSDLQVSLFGGAGSLLSTPRLCGNYNTTVELTPWSNASPVATSSQFSVVSGPEGAPCPTDDGETEPEDDEETEPEKEGDVEGGGDPESDAGEQPQAPPGSAVPLPGPTLPSGQGGNRKRPCPKGRRRVQHNGKVRCVKRHRTKGKGGAGRHAGHRR